MINRESAAPPSTAYPLVRRKVSGLLILFGFIFVGAVPMVVTKEALAVRALGALSLICAGLLGGVTLSRVLRQQPELVLDADGLEHYRLGRIRWDEISSVRTAAFARTEVIKVSGHDGAPFPPRAPRAVRLAVTTDRRTGLKSGVISVMGLPVGAAELVEEMRRYCPGLTVLPPN
ncbi:STM3941 family protein [Kitasatospora sp. NPDC092948]|uniref:STM3941 family protein n=1 Tax=Kitasatospora sp. NPDC092948 TaxID=3364088 RepID=UPI00381265A6